MNSKIEDLRAQLAASQARECRMREALNEMFKPAHLDGCLWLDDHRMPCQCGSAERIRKWEADARTALSASAPCPHAADAERLKSLVDFFAKLSTVVWEEPRNGHGWRLWEKDRNGNTSFHSEAETPLMAGLEAMDADRLRTAEKGGGR